MNGGKLSVPDVNAIAITPAASIGVSFDNRHRAARRVATRNSDVPTRREAVNDDVPCDDRPGAKDKREVLSPPCGELTSAGSSRDGDGKAGTRRGLDDTPTDEGRAPRPRPGTKPRLALIGTDAASRVRPAFTNADFRTGDADKGRCERSDVHGRKRKRPGKSSQPGAHNNYCGNDFTPNRTLEKKVEWQQLEYQTRL